MKLKKAVGLCMQTGNLTLFNHTDGDGVLTQWISDGRACYPLLGMPYLDEDTVCTVFDIPEKKQEKMMIRCQGWPAGLRVDDHSNADRMVDQMAISINYGGSTVVPMLTRGGGITYIQRKYLAPLEDAADTLIYCEREDSNGQRYIAVFNGLLIAAIIYPYDIISDDFMEKAETIVRLTERELKQKKIMGKSKASQEDEDMDQGTLFEEPEEGEEEEDTEEGEKPGEVDDDTDRS